MWNTVPVLKLHLLIISNVKVAKDNSSTQLYGESTVVTPYPFDQLCDKLIVEVPIF